MVARVTLLLLLSGALFAAPNGIRSNAESAVPPSEADLKALLAQMQANMSANWKLAEQYTSDELWHNQNFDKNGKATLDHSAKFENVFVEDLPYRRKVEEDGKPLTGKEAEEEEKRYEQAVSERRSMSLEQKSGELRSVTVHFSLPLCCLLTLFQNRVVRHEMLNGRENIVIESLPAPGVKPANSDEKTALAWKQTTWVDAAEVVPTRMEAELLVDRGHMAKGMTIRFDFARLIDTAESGGKPERAVWVQHATEAKGRFKYLWFGSSVVTTQTWSNYKKFRVDMRLLEDSVHELR